MCASLKLSLFAATRARRLPCLFLFFQPINVRLQNGAITLHEAGRVLGGHRGRNLALAVGRAHEADVVGGLFWEERWRQG